jgi:hypothetical protein
MPSCGISKRCPILRVLPQPMTLLARVMTKSVSRLGRQGSQTHLSLDFLHPRTLIKANVRFRSFATNRFSAVAIGSIADNGRHWRKADIAVVVWIGERGPPTGAALLCLKAALDSYRARLAIIETAFAHKDHPLAVVFLRHDGAEPHMATTRGASNDRKYKLFGYVR